MNNYETVFILTPVLSEAQMKEAVEKFKSVLTNAGAKIVNEENWGLKKLAYPIEKKSTGFYELFQFDAEPEVVDTLETQFRRDERVIRFLTVKMDKYAQAYAEKRRGKIASGEIYAKKEAAPAKEAAPEIVEPNDDAE
ncbi:MAG: 30S ribosomal protein S6 [Paludibacteraceae bacterium]|nr:30S ribosomal protein S6 [Paludibacteraceae bacterium]